jgi:purine-nucleoside phosphorylase
MLRLLGSDCTGMSSVPEVLVARHQGIPVLLLSLVTNTAYPPSVIRETTVDDVVAIAKAAEPRLTQLLGEILRRLT